jgi:hypothetical protein
MRTVSSGRRREGFGHWFCCRHAAWMYDTGAPLQEFRTIAYLPVPVVPRSQTSSVNEVFPLIHLSSGNKYSKRRMLEWRAIGRGCSPEFDSLKLKEFVIGLMLTQSSDISISINFYGLKTIADKPYFHFGGQGKLGIIVRAGVSVKDIQRSGQALWDPPTLTEVRGFRL